jgi:hypothetical protein
MSVRQSLKTSQPIDLLMKLIGGLGVECGGFQKVAHPLVLGGKPTSVDQAVSEVADRIQSASSYSTDWIGKYVGESGDGIKPS